MHSQHYGPLLHIQKFASTSIASSYVSIVTSVSSAMLLSLGPSRTGLFLFTHMQHALVVLKQAGWPTGAAFIFDNEKLFFVLIHIIVYVSEQCEQHNNSLHPNLMPENGLISSNRGCHRGDTLSIR